MTSLIDLFNPSFLMFLGILVLVVALVVVYFESKMRDQNHKIASMLSLVSTLAEDINGVKMGLNHLAITRFGGSIHNPLEQLNSSFITKDNNDLIEVSDDEEDDECEDEDEDDADDDDEEDEQEDEEDEDDVESIHEDIKVLKLNISNQIDNNENKSDINDVQEVVDLECLDNNLENDNKFLGNNELHGEEFKTININLEDSAEYKKFSLQKLRSIVTEKGLSTDASKYNKNKLLKLLGVE
jgi:hypothetical protein